MAVPRKAAKRVRKPKSVSDEIKAGSDSRAAKRSSRMQQRQLRKANKTSRVRFRSN